MKKIITYIALLSLVFILMSNSGGRLARGGQPSTTAPGESGQTCGTIGCHFGNTYETDIQLQLTNASGDIVSQYKPGEDYTVSINIGHIGNPGGYGFQIVSLRDSDDTGINNFFGLPAQTQELMSSNRQYVEQSDVLSSDQINIMWTAPEDGTGDITFYAAGNAVNGTGSSGGDTGDTTRVTITEDMTSSVSAITNDFNIVVYPNPAQDQISIVSDFNIKKAYLIDVNGKVIKEISNNNAIISDINNGLYYIKTLSDDGHISVMNFMKF